MYLAKAFFLVVKDAVAIYSLHFDAFVFFYSVACEEFLEAKTKIARYIFLLLGGERNSTLPLATKTATFTFEKLSHGVPDRV